MVSRLGLASSHPSDGTSRKGDRFSQLSRAYEESGLKSRTPLAIAILSVAFQLYPQWTGSDVKLYLYGIWVLHLLAAAILLSAVLAVSARTSRLAVWIFIVIAVIAILPDWTLIANHTYLALWSIPVAVLFREWWKSDLYAFYLRMTLGIVMLAAFAQKMLAGTYVDGSYIAYLSANGTPTERIFSFLCETNSSDPCILHRGISIFIVAWQLGVGLLLLLGLNAFLFLAIEIGFLLGAGIYADEMNFQILNIALLCIVFGYGMPLWLLALSLGLLVLDVYGIGNIVNGIMSYVA